MAKDNFFDGLTGGVIFGQVLGIGVGVALCLFLGSLKLGGYARRT